MTCTNLYDAVFDGELVADLVAVNYPTATEFIKQHCLCRQSYYRWISGKYQPPIGFYTLLVEVFGGDVMRFTRPGAPK